jgi:hypothetical protein
VSSILILSTNTRSKAIQEEPDFPLGAAYNRTKFVKERRVMMQSWSDFLDKLKACGDGGAGS